MASRGGNITDKGCSASVETRKDKGPSISPLAGNKK